MAQPRRASTGGGARGVYSDGDWGCRAYMTALRRGAQPNPWRLRASQVGGVRRNQALRRRHHDRWELAAGRAPWAQRQAQRRGEHGPDYDREPGQLAPAGLAAMAERAEVGPARVKRHGASVRQDRS